MKRYTSLAAFYRGDEWQTLLRIIKSERLNKEGLLICEHCGMPMVKAYDIIGHHKEPITMANVHNPLISLNPDNIQLLHHRCHNEVHNRFGIYLVQKVKIVHGSPLSGKSTFVRENKSDRDIVLDIDKLWEAITYADPYEKNNYLRTNVFALRDNILDQIRTRQGQWQTAWVIGSYPLRGERERLADRLGAELIHIDTSRDECMRRASERPEQWQRYIDEYFDKYQE